MLGRVWRIAGKATSSPTTSEIAYGTQGNSVQDIKSYGYKGQHDHFIDKYAAQDCHRNLPTDDWLQADNEVNYQDMVTFQSSPSAWSSPGDCYNATKNCVLEAINKGATKVVRTAAAVFAKCYMGFHLRDWPAPPTRPRRHHDNSFYA